MLVILFSLVNVFPCAVGLINVNQKVLTDISSQSLFNHHLDAFLKAGKPNKIGTEAGAGVVVNMGGAIISSILDLLPEECFHNLAHCDEIQDIQGMLFENQKFDRLEDTIGDLNDYINEKMAKLISGDNGGLNIKLIAALFKNVSAEFTNLADQSADLRSQLESLIKTIWNGDAETCLDHAFRISTLADHYKNYIDGISSIQNGSPSWIYEFITKRNEWFMKLDTHSNWLPSRIKESLDVLHECIQGDAAKPSFFVTYQKKLYGHVCPADDALYAMAVMMQWFQDLFQEGNILLSHATCHNLFGTAAASDILTQVRKDQVYYLVQGIHSYAAFWNSAVLYQKHESFYCSSGVLAMPEADEKSNITCTWCWKHVKNLQRGSQCGELNSFADAYERLRSLWDPLWSKGTESMTDGKLGVYYTDTLLSAPSCSDSEVLDTERYFTDFWVENKCLST